jgi:hypothetical protein
MRAVVALGVFLALGVLPTIDTITSSADVRQNHTVTIFVFIRWKGFDVLDLYTYKFTAISPALLHSLCTSRGRQIIDKAKGRVIIKEPVSAIIFSATDSKLGSWKRD